MDPFVLKLVLYDLSYPFGVLLMLILAIVVFGVYGTGYDGAAFLYTQF